MPVMSFASWPVTRRRRVVLIRCATAPGQRPWWASPQPTRPSSVTTLTMTASRLTVRPMPSVTAFFGSTGNDVGYARTSVMRMPGMLPPCGSCCGRGTDLLQKRNVDDPIRGLVVFRVAGGMVHCRVTLPGDVVDPCLHLL